MMRGDDSGVMGFLLMSHLLFGGSPPYFIYNGIEGRLKIWSKIMKQTRMLSQVEIDEETKKLIAEAKRLQQRVEALEEERRPFKKPKRYDN